MDEREQFANCHPSRESLTGHQELQPGITGRRCGKPRHDAERLVRYPYDLAVSRRVGKHILECLSSLRAYIAEDSRVKDNQASIKRCLGDHTSLIFHPIEFG